MVTYLRYYPKGSKHKFVLSEEQFDEMVKTMGLEEAMERDNACIRLIPETDEEALRMFNESCERVIANPRFYLDNLDIIPTFSMRYRILYDKLDEENRNVYK